jgi:tRNA(Ile)-lysidine synthase
MGGGDSGSNPDENLRDSTSLLATLVVDIATRNNYLLTMFNLIRNIPRDHFYFACSGGKDSMVFLDFLMKYPKNDFTILHFNHSTEHGNEAEMFVKDFCEKNHLRVEIGRISSPKKKEESQEEYWRNQRYAFFDQFDGPTLMGHHLADVMETWIFTTLRGNPRLIPIQRGKYLRPFLLTSRKEIDDWAVRHNVKWIQDPSNDTCDHSRNIIRHEMMSIALRVNPGLEKTMRKMLLNE